MHQIKNLLVAFVVTATLFSCKEDDPILVDGNQAPPDPTIENVTKENYVNKLYISILGRKATDTEFNDGLSIIEKDNLSQANREELIDIIQAKSDYWNNEYKIARANLLNGIDTSDISDQVWTLEFAKTLTADPDEIALYDKEIARLTPLLTIVSDLTSGTIDFYEVHERCVNNLGYDEINMGTENYVVSLFQNFLSRYPTTAELEDTKTMVDGVQAILFFEIGESKDDCIDIFFASDEYYEGQIRAAFSRFLFREPTSDEMTTRALIYQADSDYKKMQKYILSLDEYVGL